MLSRLGLVLAAVLLTAMPVSAQECEDCAGGVGTAESGYSDELAPETGVFARPIVTLRERFVASELDRALGLNNWSLRIIGVSTDSDQPDFGVRLQVYSSRGETTTHISGGSLAISSKWYELLFDERTPLHYDSTDFERRENAARQMLLAEYGDTQPNPSDSERLTKAKALVNARLQNSAATKCEATIDNQLAERIQRIMDRMIARARYSEGSEIVYASKSKMRPQYYPFRFHFQADYEGVYGDTQMIGTKPAMMVQAAMALRDFCQTSDGKHLAVLRRALDGLEKKLPKEK